MSFGTQEQINVKLPEGATLISQQPQIKLPQGAVLLKKKDGTEDIGTGSPKIVVPSDSDPLSTLKNNDTGLFGDIVDDLQKGAIASLAPIEKQQFDKLGGTTKPKVEQYTILANIIAQRQNPVVKYDNSKEFLQQDIDKNLTAVQSAFSALPYGEEVSKGIDQIKKDIIDEGDASVNGVIPSIAYANERKKQIDTQITDLKNAQYVNDSSSFGGVASGGNQSKAQNFAELQTQIDSLNTYKQNLVDYTDNIAKVQVFKATKEKPIDSNDPASQITNHWGDVIGTRSSEDNLLRDIGMNYASLFDPIAVENKQKNLTSGADKKRNSDLVAIENFGYERDGVQVSLDALDVLKAQGKIDDGVYLAEKGKLEKAGNQLITKYPEVRIQNIKGALGQILDTNRDNQSKSASLVAAPLKSLWQNIVNTGYGDSEVQDAIDELNKKGANITKAEAEYFINSKSDIGNTSLIGRAAGGLANFSNKLETTFGLQSELDYENSKTLLEKHFGNTPNKATEQPQTIISTEGNKETNPQFLEPVKNPEAGLHNWGWGTVNLVADGIGTVAKIYALTELTGGLADELVGTQVGTDVLGYANNGIKLVEQTALSAAQKQTIGTIAGVYIDTYQDAKDAAKNFIGDKEGGESAREAYANIMGLANGIAWTILPANKIVQDIASKSATIAAGDFAKMIPEEGLAGLKQPQVENFLVNTFKQTAEAQGKMSSISALTQISQYAAQAMYNPQSVENRNLGQEVVDGALQGLSFLPITLLEGRGIAKNIDNVNNFQKEAIYRVASDPASFKEFTDQQVKDGTINQQEANLKISLINTMFDIRSKEVPQELSKSEKVEYANNLLFTRKLQQENKSIKDTVQTKNNDIKISELEKRREEILNTTTGKITYPEAPLSPVIEKTENGTVQQDVTIKDTEIKPTFDKIQPVLSDEQISIAQPIIDRVNNADNINEKDIDGAQNVLYEALDKNPDAAHLIEPLILKLQNYEFTTKTETGTITEKVPIEGTFANKSKQEIRPALELSTGSEADVTNGQGEVKSGKLTLQDGNYILEVPNEQSIVIGEKAITDRDLKLPDETKVPEPIAMDSDGNVSAVTFETRTGDLVTIKNPERALDIAIQLQAEAVGKIPDAAFEKAYDLVQKEVITENVVNKNETQNNKNSDNKSESIDAEEKRIRQEGRELWELPYEKDKSGIKTGDLGVTEKGKLGTAINISDLQKKLIGGALNEGKYEKAIKDGNMSAGYAERVIESAGFEVPQDILIDAGIQKNKNEIQQPVENKAVLNKDTNKVENISLQKETEPSQEVKISKQAIFDKYGKQFEKTKIGWNDVTKNALDRLREDAERKNTTVDSEAEYQVLKMVKEIENNRLLLSEDRITTATLHLMNTEAKIDDIQKQKADTPDERAALAISLERQLLERDLTLKVIDALGTKAGRNLGLFSGIFSKIDDGGITITRKRIEGTLGIEIPSTEKELDANADMSPWQKERVRPYVKKIEEIKNEYEKRLSELEKEKPAIQKKEKIKASKSIRDFAEKVRNSKTLDKIGLGDSGLGKDAQINGLTLNVKELLANALDFIADGIDKGEELTKLILEAAKKYKGENKESDFKNLIDLAVGKLPKIEESYTFNDKNNPQTFDVKSDAVNEERELIRRQTLGQLNQLTRQAEEANRKWYSKIFDWRRSFIIGGIKTLGRVAISGVSKFIIDPIAKQTTGRITSLLPGLSKESVSLKSAAEGFTSLIKFKDNKTAQDYINAKLKSLETVSKKLDNSDVVLSNLEKKYGKDSNEYQKYQGTEHRKIQQEYQVAELENAKTAIYKWINGNGFTDAKDLVKYGSTSFEQAMGGYGQINTSLLSKGDKILYYIETMNRLHAVLKNPSARRALVETYNSKLEHYQDTGIPLTASTRMRALDLAYGEFLSGKYQEHTQLNDYVNQRIHEGENKGASSVQKIISGFLKITLPVRKVGVNIVKGGIDMSTVGVEGVIRYIHETSKGVKFNKEQGKVYDNVFKQLADGARNMPEKDQAYINKVLQRGLFGLGLMLYAGYAVSNGTIQYGGEYDDAHKAKRKYKDQNGVWQELDYGEWVINGVSMGKFGSSVLNHLPEFLPVAMVVNSHNVYEYEHEYRGKDGTRKLKTSSESFYEAFKSDVNEISERLPYKNILEPAQLAQSLISIQLTKDISEYFDKDSEGNLTPRKPANILQTIEQNIGLRKLVDLKKK